MIDKIYKTTASVNGLEPANRCKKYALIKVNDTLQFTVSSPLGNNTMLLLLVNYIFEFLTFALEGEKHFSKKVYTGYDNTLEPLTTLF